MTPRSGWNSHSHPNRQRRWRLTCSTEPYLLDGALVVGRDLLFDGRFIVTQLFLIFPKCHDIVL